MAAPHAPAAINYQAEQAKLSDFLQKFEVKTAAANDADRRGRRRHVQAKKYLDMLQDAADRKIDTIVIDLEDVAEFDEEDELVGKIEGNTKRYVDLFSNAIDELMPMPTNPTSSEQDNVIDIIIEQRTRRDENNADDAAGEQVQNQFPVMLKRRYSVFIKPLSKSKAKAVRNVGADDIGHLVKVRGIITRVSDVKPLLIVNAYSCDQCGCEVFQEVKSRSLTPLEQCPSEPCKRNRTKGRLYMQTRASKFLRFQEAKIQELTDQVPMGHIPRTMTIHLYEGLCRSMNTGDIVTVSGIFLPTPYTGFKALRAGLIADTYLEAHSVEQMKKTYDSMTITDQEVRRINRLASEPDVYSKLARSICPEIYGHEDVKKAILLLLIGGVTKEVGDGMKIRGDLNICLMGDPGVAKSQLLKWVSKTAPRAVYTTGKGSSGVGLTAAVMKDPVTNEMVLEGGALVLADNGICCIDEFDKMEDGDKTAIHEVMEQQTISISKAGIVTTLNARTSILAAANPVYGRYNTSLTAIQNINLPAALLSRFDILFLILDNPSMDDDTRLAQYVTHVHMHNKHPDMDFEPISAETIRNYIAQARSFRPSLTREVSDYVVGIYVGMRREQAEALQNQKKYGSKGRDEECSYTTARTLVSIVRLAQALARLRFSETVELDDVNEAVRLISVSKLSLDEAKNSRKRNNAKTIEADIFNVIKDMSRAIENPFTTLDLNILRTRLIHMGFNEEQLQRTLALYEEGGIIQVDHDSEKLVWLTGGQQIEA
ncbi:MCM-domain-containing protein [Paraphysoderma sedebokerense]|nr:MCM-domain-containing protein [Paraphysoderma sedebokerense]